MIWRVLGALYLTVGCAWTWRCRWILTVSRWKGFRLGFERQGFASLSGAAAFGVAVYEFLLEIAFWPLGVWGELRFRKWLRVNVAKPSTPAPVFARCKCGLVVERLVGGNAIHDAPVCGWFEQRAKIGFVPVVGEEVLKTDAAEQDCTPGVPFRLANDVTLWLPSTTRRNA